VTTPAEAPERVFHRPDYGTVSRMLRHARVGKSLDQRSLIDTATDAMAGIFSADNPGRFDVDLFTKSCHLPVENAPAGSIVRLNEAGAPETLLAYPAAIVGDGGELVPVPEGVEVPASPVPTNTGDDAYGDWAETND